MKNIIKKTGDILMKIGYYLSMICVFLLMLFYIFEYYQYSDSVTVNDYIYQIPFVIVCFYFYFYKRKFRYFSLGLIFFSIYLLYQCILLNFEILNVYTIAIFNLLLLYLIYLIEKSKEYIIKINYVKILLLIFFSYNSLFYSEKLYIYSKINYIEKSPEYSFYLSTPTDRLYNKYVNKDILFKKQIEILNINYSIKQIINYKDVLYTFLAITIPSHENKYFKYRKDDFLTKINYETHIVYTVENKIDYFSLFLCSTIMCLEIDDLPENKKNELIELNNKIREKYNIK